MAKEDQETIWDEIFRRLLYIESESEKIRALLFKLKEKVDANG